MELLSPSGRILLVLLAHLVTGWLLFYYEMIIKDDSEGEKNLSQCALNKRVIPVSRAHEIAQTLSRLRGDFGKFRDDFGLLRKHLGHAQSSYKSTEGRLEQFAQRLLSADKNQELVEFRSYDSKMLAR